MQRHHRSLAEADESEARIVEAEPRQFGVEKGVERRPRRDDAAPALVLAARVVGREDIEREPLPARRRAGAALGRVRRNESGVGQQLPPLPAELDEVVAVGAVAVQEHDQPLGGSGLGIEARAGQFGGHRQELQRGVGKPSSAKPSRCGAAGDRARRRRRRPRQPPSTLLPDHAGALLDAAIVGPQQPRRDAAQGPPALGDLFQLARVGPLLETERQPRRLLQREVAGGKRVGMAEAEQQEEIGGPRPDALDRDQRVMRRLGFERGERRRDRGRWPSPRRAPSARSFSPATGRKP